ncbi:MAG: PH domain-containing protein [Deltaproteobacteria bacterium]|jgi:hypothetical protein|nr:PH domain-containing protein [Deltaproteobacteria bacterium]
MLFFNNDLDDRITENGYFGFWKTFGIIPELKYIPELLFNDEQLLAVTRGRVDTTAWVMAVTDFRIILVNKGHFYGCQLLEVPFSRIKSASYRTGLFFGSIYIDTGGGTVILERLNKKNTLKVATIISQVLNEKPELCRPGQPQPAPKASHHLTGQLELLSSLRQRGSLSESEYNFQKNRLLINNDPVSARRRPITPETKPEQVSSKRNLPASVKVETKAPDSPKAALPSKVEPRPSPLPKA